MKRSSFVVGGLVAAIGVLAGCGITQPLFEGDQTVQVEHVPRSPVEVRTVNGSVEIEAVARDDVRIDAHIRARTAERLDAVLILAERTPDGALSIHAQWPDGRRLNNEGCRFTIQLPDAAGVTVQTSNGGITIAGLAGRAELETSNGAITITGHDGPVQAKTSNGRITMDGVTGPIVADTSNGRVNIDLPDAATGPVTIDTSNGAVALEVGPAFAGALTMDTSNGSVRLHGVPDSAVQGSKSRKHVNLVIGDDGQPSSIDTSNGSITFTIRQ
jgi:DUF4097 and DUF4098 domain-containing protein YvlB